MDSFPIIRNWLDWKVGDSKQVKLGLDPLVGGIGL